MKALRMIINEIDPFLTSCLLKILDLMGWGRLAQVARGRVLRFLGYKIGKKASLSSGVRIGQRKDPLYIGDGTFVNQNVYFDATAPVIIGKYCDIGYNVVFASSKHELVSNYNINRPVAPSEPITVEDHVWIGCNAVLLSGVKIGKGSVVAAGSVVTKNVPPGVMVAGIPAKVIKNLH